MFHVLMQYFQSHTKIRGQTKIEGVKGTNLMIINQHFDYLISKLVDHILVNVYSDHHMFCFPRSAHSYHLNSKT